MSPREAMTDEIKAALSAEEWASERARRDAPFNDRVTISRDGGVLRVSLDTSDVVSVEPVAFHALAALALHGMPFGFTPADIDVLHEALRWYEEDAQQFGADEKIRARLQSLIARIAALLPPSSG